MKKEGILEYVGIVIFVALASLVAAGVINKNTSAPETAALALVDEDDGETPAVAAHKEPAHKEPAHKEPEHKEPEHKPETAEHKEPAKPDPKPESSSVKSPEPPAKPDHKDPAEAAKPPAPAADEAVTYELNEDEFTLAITGYGPFGDQVIEFYDCLGKLKMTPGKPETISFDGEVSMQLMENKHAKLIKSLSAKEFFDVENHPEAYFTSSSVKKTGGGYEITGSLEIKGIKKKIKYPATITESGDDVTIESEFRVLKSWWELEYSATALEIKDEALISLALVFSK